MKKLITMIFVLQLSFYMNAQSYGISDYYVHDALAINPAFAGNEDALSMSLLYRDALMGFEGSPKTMSFSVHAPLNHEKIGLGLLIVHDKIGVSRETNFVGNYAYRMDLGYGKLSFGLGIGMTLVSADWAELAAQDPGDVVLSNNSSTSILPDFSCGMYYKTKKYFIGLSVPSLLNHEYDYQTGKYIIKNDLSDYSYYCHAGYYFIMSQNIKISPSVLINYQKRSIKQLDINTQVSINNRVVLGAAYRSKNMLVGMFEIQANDQLRLACSYDFNMGKKGQYDNSYELVLSYVFKYLVEVAGPREF